MKDYLLRILNACAPGNGFAQDAIDAAIARGMIVLTFDFDTDIQQITSLYDAIVQNYHGETRRAEATIEAAFTDHSFAVPIRGSHEGASLPGVRDPQPA